MCSPSDTGIGGQYNSLTQGDDTVSMSNLTMMEMDSTPVTTVSVAKKGMQLSAPRSAEGEDTVSVPGAPVADAAVVSTTDETNTDSTNATGSVSDMTSPFTMKFEDDEDDDGAWKAF